MQEVSHIRLDDKDYNLKDSYLQERLNALIGRIEDTSIKKMDKIFDED